MAAPVSQPVRSTLLDGNHAFPPLYACYLLRSKTKPNVTYIGSSPDPPRRLRQHNGEIAAGAVYTARCRPWEMQMIVYGYVIKGHRDVMVWLVDPPFFMIQLPEQVDGSSGESVWLYIYMVYYTCLH
jgi:hypothetical protein